MMLKIGMRDYDAADKGPILDRHLYDCQVPITSDRICGLTLLDLAFRPTAGSTAGG